MQTTDLVKAALKDKNPALFKELSATGQLSQFVREKSDEIRSAIVTLTMEMSAKDRAKHANDPMAISSLLKGHEAAAREIVLAEMLEFPQD